MNPFLLLFLAIVAEVVATTSLKLSNGMTRLIPTLVMITGYGIALWLMSISIRTIPVGVTYAIWAGLGTVGIVIVGLVLFHEKLDAPRIIGITLIISGVIILNLFSRVHA